RAPRVALRARRRRDLRPDRHEPTLRAFFFQAEDGIRDRTVTGVQTCALPILWRDALGSERFADDLREHLQTSELLAQSFARVARSEERRVGKECRCRGGAYYATENDSVKRPSPSMRCCNVLA